MYYHFCHDYNVIMLIKKYMFAISVIHVLSQCCIRINSRIVYILYCFTYITKTSVQNMLFYIINNWKYVEILMKMLKIYI